MRKIALSIAVLVAALLLTACGSIVIESFVVPGSWNGTPFSIAIGQGATAETPTLTATASQVPSATPFYVWTLTPSHTPTPSATPAMRPSPTSGISYTATPVRGTSTPQPPPDSLLPVADSNFTPDSLPPDMRVWYDRLWAAAYHEERYPWLEGWLAKGDTYVTSRAVDQYVTGLSGVLRATGDPAALEEIYRLYEIMRGAMRDTNNDGYLNLTEQSINCPHSTLCGKDIAAINETLLFGSIGHWTYVLWVNRGIDPRYADAAAWGLDYLENHHLAKWRERKPYMDDYQWLDKSLVHTYSGMMRGYWYLWRMTGNGGYLGEAERRAAVLVDSTEQRNGYCWIDHRVPDMGHVPWGAHPTTYAMHTFGMWSDLMLDGFTAFEPEFMACWADTLRDAVLSRTNWDTLKMPARIDGSGEDNLNKFAISSAGTLALWDDTGDLWPVAERVWDAVVGHERQAHIPAVGMLVLGQTAPTRAVSFAPPVPGRGGIVPTADTQSEIAFVRVYETNGDYQDFVRAVPLASPSPDEAAVSTPYPPPTPEEAPPLAERTPTATPVPDVSYAYIVAPSGVNLRSCPRVSCADVGGVNLHSCVEILDRRDGWYKVPGGWITGNPSWVDLRESCPVAWQPTQTQTPAYSGGGHAYTPG